MSITGKNLIAGEWSGDTSNGFSAMNAITNQTMHEKFADASEQEIEQAIDKANHAFVSYSQLTAEKKAFFLRTIGEQIIALGDDLVDMACAETGLPAMRIQGERGRTVGQLGLFANLLETGEYHAVVDLADANRVPLGNSHSGPSY